MTFITHTTMIAEEKYLEDKYGKKQPFKVPNGYFDSFADNLMDKLPEQQPVITPHISMWRKLRLTVAVAASVCAVMFSVMTFMHDTKAAHSQLAVSSIAYEIKCLKCQKQVLNLNQFSSF